MSELLTFMGQHPVLTFFLALMLAGVFTTALKALGGKYRCSCGKMAIDDDEEEEEEDE